jgi:hypothetical protein
MKKLLLFLVFTAVIGLVNAQNPYPIIPLHDVQFVSSSKLTATPPNDSSDYVNPTLQSVQYKDTIRFEGYVLFDPRLYGLSTTKSRRATVIVADTIVGPWGGVELMCDPAGMGTNLTQLVNDNSFYDNLRPGTKVRVTGLLKQFRGSSPPAGSKLGHTQINVIKANANWDNGVEILDVNPHQITPITLTVDSLMTGNANIGQVANPSITEKYEGAYVELKNVSVFTRTLNGSRWTWSVADANGNAIDISDFSGWYRNDNNSEDSLPANRFTPPIIGTKLSYIRGVVIHSLIAGEYRYVLAPLTPSDLGAVSYMPPVLASKNRMPVVASSADAVTFTAKVTQGDYPVSKVEVFYAAGLDNSLFSSATLTRNTLPNDTMTWTGNVPALPNGSIVKYYIRMTDINGVYQNSPDSLATNSVYLVMDGGPKTIKDLQFSINSKNGSIWSGDSLINISVNAIVTSTNMAQQSYNILTLQTKNSTDSNSAIVVNRSTNDGTGAWKVGDEVTITSARVQETSGLTTLNSVFGTVVSSGNTLPAFKSDIQISDIAALNASSSNRWKLNAFEGMLVSFDNVYIVNTNADGANNYGEFLVNQDSTATVGLRVDDMSSVLPDLFNQNLKAKQYMKRLRGVLHYSFSNWKLQPRDSNDLDFAPSITLLGNNPDSLKLNMSYEDPGFTALDDVDGDLSANVTVTSFVDSSRANTYGILYSVADLSGNRVNATRSVVVYAPTSINENELAGVLTTIYPNPAKEELAISISGVKTLPLQIEVIDLSGRVLNTRSYTSKEINDNINVSNFSNGVYFLRIKNENGFKAIKFVVTK